MTLLHSLFTLTITIIINYTFFHLTSIFQFFSFFFYRHDYTSDAQSLGSTNFGFGMTGKSPTHGGVSGYSTNGFVSGPQAESLLPCCKVCPEQFLMPETLEDVSTSFIELEEKTKEKMTEKNQETTDKGFMASVAGMMGKTQSGGSGSFNNGPTSMNTGYVRTTCCNICDQKTRKQKSSFIEAMENTHKNRKRGIHGSHQNSNRNTFLLEQRALHRKKGFIGGAMGGVLNAAMSGGLGMNGGTGGCCPVCPNLQIIMNANVPQDEAFGGPFAPGMESSQSGASLTKKEQEALKVIADQAGIDETQARRDPGMASAVSFFWFFSKVK